MLSPLPEFLAAREPGLMGWLWVYSRWDGGCSRLLTAFGRSGAHLPFWLFFPSPGLLLLLLCGLRAGKCRRCSCWRLPSPSVLSSEACRVQVSVGSSPQPCLLFQGPL